MAKIRSIHPDTCASRTLMLLSPEAERTWWRLLLHTDDEGRGPLDPVILRNRCYEADEGTVTAGDVMGHLDQLREYGLIAAYSNGTKDWYHIPSWDEYQHPKHRSQSRAPDPNAPESTPLGPPSNPDRDQTDPRPGPGLVHGEGEGDGGGEGGGDAETPSPSAPDIEERFEAWWQAYPRHAKNAKPGGGGSRKTAASAFRRLAERKRKLAEEALPHYRAWVESPDGEYPCHASTWLNEARWEQWQEGASIVRLRDGPSYGEVLPDGTRRGVM